MSSYGYGSHPQFSRASATNSFYTELHVPGGGRNHYTRASSTLGSIPRAVPPRARPRPSSSNLRYNSRGQVDPNGHTINEWQSKFGEWFDENYDASDRLMRDRINMDFVDHITSGRAAELIGYESPYSSRPARSSSNDHGSYRYSTDPHFPSYESPKSRRPYPAYEDDDEYIISSSKSKGNRRSSWSDSYRRPSHRTLTRSHRSNGSRWEYSVSSVFQAVGDLFSSPFHGTTSLLDKGPGSTRAVYEKRGRSNGQGAFIRNRRR
ncbi:hypothetical protein V865_001822 [Kwoniella europaea PYCC6329]|uniref:Uncharacterized protein n=1 Tax=Kwoniella europaea PYCC6329 TaxID=1423913 RepID=A0AAX4KBH1_9TREE